MRSAHHATRQAKIAWLLEHQSMWEGWVAVAPGDPRRWDIVQAMKAAGLYSPSTYWLDVHLNNLIQAARKQRRCSKS